MRVLVQRVTSASVSVDGDVVGEIRPSGQGLLALVGVTHSDTDAIARRLAENSGSYGFSTPNGRLPTPAHPSW
jgi:D-Tyr-tRNAtyr deacylase